MAKLLQQLMYDPRHQFWADSLSLLTAPGGKVGQL